MSVYKVKQSLANLANALDRLNEAVQNADSVKPGDIVIDGTIQRFEFSYELFWKTLRQLLMYEGIADITTPREVMKQAFKIGWLDNEDAWLQMREDRNTTSHVYDNDKAFQIFCRIRSIHAPEMTRVYKMLIERFQDLL